MSDPGKAVFLSYASQDAEAARKICEALRAGGVEVWFDQSELVGGDSWDAKIRKQIADCALFVPLISAATQARREGYFRLEWRLAAHRTHMMSEQVAFLLPVVIDGTRDGEADVPPEFKAVQWTRLPSGETSATFCERVNALLGGDVAGRGTREGFASESEGVALSATKKNRRWFAPAVAAIGAAVALSIWQPWRQSVRVPEPPAVKSPPVAKPLSEARQLVARARAITLDKYNSTADDFAAGEGLIRRALELDANDGELWAVSSLFNTAIRTRGYDNSRARREAARSQAERAVALAPDSIEGRYALGRWQRDNEPDGAVAEQTFKEVLARAPHHGGALMSLGVHYSRMDRFEDAITMFERAAQDSAGMPLARYNQYLAYFDRSHFEEAERCLRESIAVEPSANSVTGLAMVLLTAKGDARAAVQALADLPVANRTEHRAVWISAQAHLASGDPDKALTALSRLSADFIQDNWFVGPKAYWVGRAHAQAGRLEAARLAFESGLPVIEAKLKTAGENATLHLARGELLAWLGQADEALREARTVVELSRGRDRPWFISPVRIHAALGRADEAVPLLQKLLVEAAAHHAVGWPLTPALLRVDPLWDRLRADSRFLRLLDEAPEQKSNAGRREPKQGATKVDPKSVAVLAFANLSDDKENEYFSDGISEELLNVLAKVPGLRVAARTSAFYFKGKNATAQEIGQKLGVAHLVDGSVRRDGASVRVVARLSRADTGEQLWSDKFEGELKNIFALQDEIAGRIAENLKLKLGTSTAAKREVNPEAHRLYLEGRHFWSQRSNEGFSRAETALKKAIELDPQFARAHAGLADLWAIRGWYYAESGVAAASLLLAQAEAAARKALALDPSLTEIHATFGAIHLVNGRLREAEREIAECLAVVPSYATALNWRAEVMLRKGRLDQAVNDFVDAARLDPLSPVMLFDCARVLLLARRPTAALEYADRAHALSPYSIQANVDRARALLELDRPVDAAAAIRVVGARLASDNSAMVRVAAAVHILRQAGETAEAATLAGAAMRTEAANSFIRGFFLASLGRADEALPFLAQTPPGFVQTLFWNAFFDPLHADPRFQDIMVKLGCAGEYKTARETLARMVKEDSANK